MKTTRSVRRVWKLRIAIFGLVLATLAGIELTLGYSPAARWGRATAPQTEALPLPNLDLSVLVASTW